ncbi:MAG: oligosaccharide flippase family protein [Halioglobus sp.]
MSSEDRAHSRGRFSGRDFLKRSAFAGAIRVLGLLCVFVLQVFLARLIGNGEEYGKYAWGQSLMFLMGSLACLGLPVVTSRFIAALRTQHNEAAIKAIVTRATSLLLRTSALLLLIALALAIFWHAMASDNPYRNVAILAFALAPGITFANLYQDLCRARQWLGLALLPLNVFRPIVTGILAFCAWQLYNRQLTGDLIMSLAGISVLVILLTQFLLYHLRVRRIDASHDALLPQTDYQPSQLLRTALPVFAMRCATLTIRYSNVLLVGFLAGPLAAGAYFAAERLAQLAAIPQSVVSSVNQQSMAAAHATGNITGLQKVTSQSAHGSLWPTLLIGIGLVILASPLLQLFGDDFPAARTVLIALVVCNVVDVLTGPAQDVLIMTGRQRQIPRVMLVSATVHVIALCLLVPQIGAVGAALSSIASGLIANGWLMWLAHKEVGIGTTVMGKRTLSLTAAINKDTP